MLHVSGFVCATEKKSCLGNAPMKIAILLYSKAYYKLCTYCNPGLHFRPPKLTGCFLCMNSIIDKIPVL